MYYVHDTMLLQFVIHAILHKLSWQANEWNGWKAEKISISFGHRIQQKRCLPLWKKDEKDTVLRCENWLFLLGRGSMEGTCRSIMKPELGALASSSFVVPFWSTTWPQTWARAILLCLASVFPWSQALAHTWVWKWLWEKQMSDDYSLGCHAKDTGCILLVLKLPGKCNPGTNSRGFTSCLSKAWDFLWLW